MAFFETNLEGNHLNKQPKVVKGWQGSAEMALNNNSRKVKGAFIIPLAMIINSRKHVDWVKYGGLTPEDMALVKDYILASNWYDMDFFIRISSAVFRLVGNNSPEGAREFGQGIMWDTLAKIYGLSLLRNDPISALRKFAILYNGIFFNTGVVDFSYDEQPSSDGICKAVFRIFDPEGIPVPEFFIQLMKSLLEKILQENNAEKIVVRYDGENQLEGQKVYSAIFNLSWRENPAHVKKIA